MQAAAEAEPGCDKVADVPREEAEHGGDAESGKAKGGDVDQRQQASNDNRTSQTASATSRAKQEGALNLILLRSRRSMRPDRCKAC